MIFPSFRICGVMFVTFIYKNLNKYLFGLISNLLLRYTVNMQ